MLAYIYEAGTSVYVSKHCCTSNHYVVPFRHLLDVLVMKQLNYSDGLLYLLLQ